MGRDLAPLRAFGPGVRILDGNQAFEALNRARAAGDAAAEAQALAALDPLLREADVVCMSFPMLRDVAARAPRLRWLHHTQAGVSNLLSTDVWGAEHVLLTSGRGYVRPTAMAEYVIAGALTFARGIHDGYVDKSNGRLDRTHYAQVRIEGATMGVIGLGGIGKEVARLARALGMRVVATRRSAASRQAGVDHADLLLPPWELGELAAQSDFIGVCTQLTQETYHLIDRQVFAAMKPSAVLVNVSRGEVIDEEALIEALGQGRLRGAVLDVYEGELDGKPPRPELMRAPNVVLTPHVSAGGSAPDDRLMRLFCENLRRFLDDRPLLNLVDRERGY